MTAWEVVGMCGNACFFSRFLIQWALSERAKKSVAPRIFWWLSLIGSFILGAYGTQSGQYVLVAGNVLNGGIYARNLWIDGRKDTRRLGRVPAALLGIAAVVALAIGGVQTLRTNESTTVAWIACAMFGQVLWSSRFVLQWWFTEKSGKSHFPRAFWWVSLAGNLALLSYAIHLADIVYIAGFVPGPIVQLRNLALGSGRETTGRVVAADKPS